MVSYLIATFLMTMTNTKVFKAGRQILSIIQGEGTLIWGIPTELGILMSEPFSISKYFPIRKYQ